MDGDLIDLDMTIIGVLVQEGEVVEVLTGSRLRTDLFYSQPFTEM